MNPYQGVNATATGLVISAIIVGLARYFDVSNTDPIAFPANSLSIIYLGFFILVFRVKTHFDDNKHFDEEHQDKSHLRFVGYILAIFSWIFWVVAAYDLHDTVRASELMVFSFSISTLWIIVHLIEILFDKDRIKDEQSIVVMRVQWIIINTGYCILLGAHIGWFRPVVPDGLTPPLALLVVGLLIDIAVSRPWRGAIKRDAKANVAPPTSKSHTAPSPQPDSGYDSSG